MRKFIVVWMMVLFSFGVKSQHVQSISKADLVALLSSRSDTIYVVNFWATWCKPCVEELPIFEKVHQDFAGKKVKVILISNDFKKQVEPKLKPFIKSKKIQSTVWWMNETDPNSWVNSVEPMWEGSLPATLIFRGSDQKRFFNEGQLSEQTILAIIQKFQQ